MVQPNPKYGRSCLDPAHVDTNCVQTLSLPRISKAHMPVATANLEFWEKNLPVLIKGGELS